VDGAVGDAFKALVDGAPAILYAARPDGTISYANAAWTRFSGLAADAVLDLGWTDLLHPDDAPAVEARWLEAMASARPFREEFRIRDAAGEYRWVASHAQPAFDARGAVSGWYGTILDVDARRRAAQRRAILDRLGATFAESIDFRRTAQTVVSAMCRDFADFAFVDVMNERGRLERIAVEAGRLWPDAAPFFRFAPPPHAGSHPIVRVLRSGRAVIEHAVDDAWKRATTWSEEHLAFVRSLPIGSIAYVPMIAAGEHVGVLTFGTVVGGERSFSIADLGDVEEIARRAAVALANARLYRDLAASEALYRGVIDTAQEGVWILDADARTRYVNPRMAALLGYEADEMYGRQPFDFMDDEAIAQARVRLARVLAGTPVHEETRLVRKDGSTVNVLVASGPISAADGTISGALGMMTDVTERRAIEDAMARIARTREIVNRASEALGATLDLDALLGAFAELLVAELGDEATIRLQDGLAVRRGIAPSDGGEKLRATLRYRDVELGRILVRRARPFGADDQGLLDELAARAAAAIDNAQAYAREHRVAMTLQRAMLPAILPAVDGVAFDAVYRPGATEAEIGGDWYDAIVIAGGRVVVSIGDVTGRGLTAAVIMGRIRQAIESLATYESDPMRLLDAADRVLRRAHPDAIVTALIGILDPAAGTFAYATAGHPNALVRTPDGGIVALPARGLPLGLRDGAQGPTTTVTLPASSLVVLYTDGLIEATRDIAEGERRLAAALADPEIAERADAAEAIVARVLDDGVRDDVAVLTLRLGAAAGGLRPWTTRWRFDPREAGRAHDVRDMMLATLTARSPHADASAAALVFGELTANAMRHAPGPIDVELSWDDGETPVLCVDDDGPGFDAPARTELPGHEAESGRGLFLVAALTRAFTTTRRAGGGTRARAELLAG